MKNKGLFFIISSFLIALSFTACKNDKKPTLPLHSPSPAVEDAEIVIGNSNTFLFLSDVHLNSFSESTIYGDDTGMILWKAFLAKTDSILGSIISPDFVVYTGDLPGHYPRPFYLPPSKRADHNQNLKIILQGLKDLVTKHKKSLFYLPGNNDGLAGDYSSFADEKQSTPFSLLDEKVNPYPALNINSSGNIAPYMVSNPEPKMGYYSAKPIEGLRVIALNTVIYSANFFAVDGTNPIDDGNNQMKWLASELQDATQKGDKVYITMHIPPGIDAYGYKKQGDNATNWTKKHPWNNQFLQIVSDNQNTIAGILYGHTHMDELRRLYDPSGKNITEVAISSPGVTPQHYNNPGFKVVSYDATSKELLDFTTYHTIPSATAWGKASYSFNQIFGYASKKTMFENLSTDNLPAIHTKLNTIYTVMNGAPSYNIEPGIEVKMEQ